MQKKCDSGAILGLRLYACSMPWTAVSSTVVDCFRGGVRRFGLFNAFNATSSDFKDALISRRSFSISCSRAAADSLARTSDRRASFILWAIFCPSGIRESLMSLPPVLACVIRQAVALMVKKPLGEEVVYTVPTPPPKP